MSDLVADALAIFGVGVMFFILALLFSVLLYVNAQTRLMDAKAAAAMQGRHVTPAKRLREVLLWAYGRIYRCWQKERVIRTIAADIICPGSLASLLSSVQERFGKVRLQRLQLMKQIEHPHLPTPTPKPTPRKEIVVYHGQLIAERQPSRWN